MPSLPGPEHERLSVLIGVWRTEGWTREAPGAPSARIDAIDTYEWLPGGFALLHRVDARVGDERVEGAEIIGYDPERGTYVTQYFASDGPNAYEASLDDLDSSLVWTRLSLPHWFAGKFHQVGETITGHWEQLESGWSWWLWMDFTLTRQA